MKSISAPRAGPLCHFRQHVFCRPAASTVTTTTANPAVAATRLSLASQQRWLSQSSQSSLSSPSIQNSPHRRFTCRNLQSQLPRRRYSTAPPPPPPSPLLSPTQSLNESTTDLSTLHERVEELATAILEHAGVPDEDVVLQATNEYQRIAKSLLSQKTSAPAAVKPANESTASATSALLGSVEQQHSPNAVTKAELLATISDRALDIVQYEPVFITTPILQSYVELQSLLGTPESFPLVLDLYRSKPVPRPSKTHPITYTQQNPDKPAAAVPPAVADAAIDATIAVRDLALTLSTIEATYCTPAYKRSKFLRSALFPLAGLALTPPAAYTLATQFSNWQTTMDSQTATQVAMAGMLTYSGAVAMMGYITLTTANDQMVRVTWASGLPLWERWVREEERGAVDKVAQAWGFRNRDKWGEEEGDEWDALREWVGIRGMMIDRVELMDGME